MIEVVEDGSLHKIINTIVYIAPLLCISGYLAFKFIKKPESKIIIKTKQAKVSIAKT